MQQRLTEHVATALLSCCLTGVGFFLLGARNHVDRADFERALEKQSAILEKQAAILQPLTEDRGRLDERLRAVEGQLRELAVAVREVSRGAAPR